MRNHFQLGPSIGLATVLACLGCGSPGAPEDGAGAGATASGAQAGTQGTGATAAGGALGSGGAGASAPTGGVGASSTGGKEPVDVRDVVAVDPETLPEGVASQSRVLRLTYDQFDRSVSDLLGIEVEPSQLFPNEGPNLGPYEAPGERLVSEILLREVSSAAEELAREVTSEETSYLALVGCNPADATCRDTFVQNFGLRAYRRPLSVDETERFTALFDRGAELIASGDAFRDGVQLLVEAVIGSAKFLYRVEQGAPESDADGTLLTDYEVAARLSYLFWGTLPDEELLRASAAGEVSTKEQVLAQADRLAASPRLESRVLDFHARYIQLDGLASAEKDPTVYPEFGPELVLSMRREVEHIVLETTLEADGAIEQLLTTTSGFVDDRLAEIYGLSGTFTAQPVPVEFPADAGRTGLLTRAAFLTGHSSASTRTSPILRGVFLMDRVVCVEISPPPPGAQMVEPDEPPETEIQTTRQFFEWKTSPSSCVGCHSLINPAGFAFEEFDAIGRPRTHENGVAIDSSGVLILSQTTNFDFTGASMLSAELATLHETRACYAKNYLEYALGRSAQEGDLRTIGRAARDLATPGYGVRALLRGLTQSTDFLHLPTKTD